MRTLAPASAVAIGLALLTLAATAHAAPPKGPGAKQITKMVKKDFKDPNKITAVDVREGGAGATLTSDGWIWEQTIVVTRKTKMKGVTELTRGDVEYQRRGGKWRFAKFRFNSSWFEGLEPPTAEEINAILVKLPPDKVMDGNYFKQATAVVSAKVADDPRWNVEELNAVGFLMEVVFKKKASATELATMKHRHFVYVSRAAMDAPWDSLCATEKGCLLKTAKTNYSPEEVSRQTPPNINDIKPLWEAERDKWIDARLAAIGVPKTFASESEFAGYAYQALYSGDEKTWQGFIIRHGDKYEAFEQGLAQMVKRAADFRRTFCPQLMSHKVGETPYGWFVVFYDKGKQANCTLRVRNKEGWRVEQANCDVPVTSGAKADEIAAIAEAVACADPAKALAAQAEANFKRTGYRVGDKVRAQWSGNDSEYTAKIEEIEGDKVRVRYDSDGTTEWRPLSKVRKR